MASDTVDTLTVRVDEHDRRLEKHEMTHKEIWEGIDILRSRLPVWATVIISLLASGIAALLAVALT